MLHLKSDITPSNDSDTTLNDTGGISATVGIWGGQDDSIPLPAGKYVPGPHDVNGTVFEFIQGGGDFPVETVDTNDSYVRMAWDTGGAAWDIGVVDAYSEIGGINSSEADALRDAFIDSLGSQILRAAAAGEVYHNDEVLLALNVGSDTSFDAGSAGIFRADDGAYTAPVNGGPDTGAAAVDSFTITAQTVDVTSTNSIPAGTESMLQSVFASARGEATDDFVDENISFTVDKLDFSGIPTAMSDGTYVVELFFAELDVATSPGSRVFDVRLEGQTMLNDYDVFADHAKINESYSLIETDSEQTGTFTGLVKRFEVEVSHGDGLQIDLIREAGDPILNGLRILRADTTRVESVIVKGSNWADGVDYPYADVIPDGGQLRPIYLEGADTIEIHFTGPVNLSSGSLVILGDNQVPLSTVPLTAGYNAVSHVASWSLSAPLAAGKYAIQLSGVTGAAGSLLDSDWDNLFDGLPSAPTIDNFADDPVGRRLLSGDGTPGGEFQFFFAVLPGDSNQNGVVEADPNGVHADLDAGVLRDVDGDGVSGTAADAAIALSVDGEVLPFGPSSADIVDYDNDMVDVLDWIAWKSFQGTGDPRGDLDGDGDQDLSDFWIFRSNFESFSAWYTGPLVGVGSGSALSLVVTAGAPQVENVIISGSTSTHNPYSFASATNNGQPVIGSGNQLRTVPVGGADTISVTFNEDVNILANDLTLVGLQAANRPVLAEFTYDIGTLTATWRFENLGEADQYLILLADAVTDVEGNPLDGEWVNPASIFTTNSVVSEFPSGDGTAGGDFNFVFTILPGDANLDSWVQSSDQGDYWSNYYSSGEDWLFTDCDWDGDGIVDWPDEDLFYLNLGTNLQSISLLGDLNGDWVVDESDGNIIDANFGMSNPTLADGDLNADGAIDVHDLDLMFAQYGLELNVVS